MRNIPKGAIVIDPLNPSKDPEPAIEIKPKKVLSKEEVIAKKKERFLKLLKQIRQKKK